MNNMGWSNQTMATKPEVVRTRQYFTTLNPGDTSWVCPATGYYTFTIYGAGCGVNAGTLGGTGAAAQRTELIFRGQVATLSIGYGSQGDRATNGQATTVTLPSGNVMTAGGGVVGGSGGAGGAASGGDTNVSGNSAPATRAPNIGNFVGAASGLGLTSGQVPGPGAAGGSSGGSASGGPGIAYIQAGKV